MAVTVINLTDPVQTLVSKTNTISSDLGDVVLLFTGDDNAVDAINSIQGLLDSNKAHTDSLINALNNFDSSEVISISREGLSVNNLNGGGIELGYDSATGQISITSRLISSSTVAYDSSTGSHSVVSNSITSTQLNSAVTLRILDSAGTVLTTLYGAGS